MLAAGLIQGTNSATVFLLAILARKTLNASKTETLLLTAAPTVLYIFSIFWGTLFSRVRIRRYLLMYFIVGCLPYAAAALFQNVPWIIACHLLACFGGAAWPAVQGDLLRRIYPDAVRGKAFGFLTASFMLGGAAATFGLGEWLDHNPNAWQIYMPLMAGLQGIGVAIIAWIVRTTGIERDGLDRSTGSASPAGSLLKQAFEPLTHMREVLRTDRVFKRYEAAFMTYGIGWMICVALLPLIVTDKLQLKYDEISHSTHLTFLILVGIMTVPASFLMTRIGPMKMAAASFWLYTGYPLLLLTATSQTSLMLASVLYGTAAAGVNVCWMLGPVSLAGSAEKVPQYVAIHATLVGLRGAMFQALAVILYSFTSSFTWPLLIAAGGFFWAGYQMWALRQHTPPPTHKVAAT